MTDDRHLEKIEKRLYLRHGLTDLHEIWQDDAAYWSLEGYGQLKLYIF